MKLTNNFGLPTAYYRAVKSIRESYNRGESDYTITQLCRPPYMDRLLKEYDDELEVDVSKMGYAFLGSLAHKTLEEAEADGDVEDRIYTTALGKKIGMQYDRITKSGKTLQDYKVLSVWEYIHGFKEDKVFQLNSGMHIANENGYNITNVEIIAFFRDWKAGDLKMSEATGKSYPPSQTMRMKAELWSYDKWRQVLEAKVKYHMDSQYEPCTVEERWAKPDVWLVLNENENAIRNGRHATQDEAEKQLSSRKDRQKLRIVKRAGYSTRCEDYCDVSKFCPFYRKRKADEEKSSDKA